MRCSLGKVFYLVATESSQSVVHYAISNTRSFTSSIPLHCICAHHLRLR